VSLLRSLIRHCWLIKFSNCSYQTIQGTDPAGIPAGCSWRSALREHFLYRKPVNFDCVEFNARYRQIDVLSEIAFLCMDLEFYGQYSLSEILVNQYCDLFPCFQTAEDNLLFIYYKLCRANVRAKSKV